MENFLVKLNSFLWGAPVLILLFAVGLLYAVKTRFFQFRHFGLIMKETFGKIFDKGSGEGNINPFKAACTALASTLGVGNIAGVSVAIATGVPVPYSGCGSSPCWASSSSSRK